MIFSICKNGKKINTIVGTESFVSAYCAANGYSYQQIAESTHEPAPTETEQLRADVDFLSAMMGVSL